MTIYDPKADKAVQAQQGLTPALRLYCLPELGDISRTLAVYIYHADKDDGTCWASDETIAELAGVSVRTVQTHTFALLTKQYLTSLGTAKHGLPEYAINDRFKRKSKEPFYFLPIQALKQQISRAALRVYAILIFKATAEGILIDFGTTQIAKSAGLSERAVKYAIEELQKCKLLVRASNQNSSVGVVFPPCFYDPLAGGAIIAPLHRATVDDLHGAIMERLQCNGAQFTVQTLRVYSAPIADKLEVIRREKKNNKQKPLPVAPFPSGMQGEGESMEPSKGTISAVGKVSAAVEDAVDFENVCKNLLSNSSARDLLGFPDDLLGIVASAAEAQIQNHPASEECSLSRLFGIIQKHEARQDDPVCSWPATLRSDFKNKVLPKIDAWLYGGSRGAAYFEYRAEEIRKILEPFAEVERKAYLAALPGPVREMLVPGSQSEKSM